MMTKPKKLFILSCILEKKEGFARITSSMMGYRFTETEDEATGSFIKSVNLKKPGFSIDTLLCSEVPRDEILNNLDW